MSDEEDDRKPDYGDIIDAEMFEQILEMDDDENDREFSRTVVFDYFQQAESTLLRMDDAASRKDLESLGELGHFLSGAAKTLGIVRVASLAKDIKEYGLGRHEDGKPVEEDEAARLKRIRDILPYLKGEERGVERVLKHFYGES